MLTDWNYTELAEAYLKRPSYAPEVIQKLISTSRMTEGMRCCDVGAGVGHLTKMLAEMGLLVTAVEPNDRMRELGIEQTKSYPQVSWHEGTGEVTGQNNDTYDLVTFGSSFNVMNQQKALIETHRILKKTGWFACLWNHRDLHDPTQAGIERIIKNSVKDFDYGSRRQDQTAVIDKSGLFGVVEEIEGTIIHSQFVEDIIEAWRSHATLQRQSGCAFPNVIAQISEYIESRGLNPIKVLIRQNWSSKGLLMRADGTLSFSTKANNLELLRDRLSSAVVLDQVKSTGQKWRSSSKLVLDDVVSKGWLDGPLILRSSASCEDLPESSMAGHFLSVAGILGESKLVEAVEKILMDYELKGVKSPANQQFFIQPQIQNVKISGVALGRDPNTASPYIVINYMITLGQLTPSRQELAQI